MDSMKKRISSISPEKRKLLEQMLKREGMQLPEDKPTKLENNNETAMVDVLKKVSTDRRYQGHDQVKYRDKEIIQDTYNTYHQQLQSAVFHEHSIFMNLGYVATDALEHSTITLPERMVGKQYIKLVLEVIGDCDLDAKRILDGGCGRGGTINVVQTYFHPQSATGIDLASGAIDFCNAYHDFPNTRFLQGDAENFPFPDNSFDVVLNIESSHHYANIEAFYEGVYRVLSSGGHFLYTTMLGIKQFERDLEIMKKLGFVLQREVDITQNVLAACDQDRRGVFEDLTASSDNEWIANAISLPGSETYTMMERGDTAYKIFKLEKPR